MNVVRVFFGLVLAFLCILGIRASLRIKALSHVHAVEVPTRARPPARQHPGRLPDTLLADPRGQAFAAELLSRNPSVYALAVGFDLRTARPLFIVEARPENGSRRMAVSANLQAAVTPRYPAASLAKTLTSLSLFENTQVRPDSRISLRGNLYTLYRSQLDTLPSRDSVSIADAFGKSVNQVFGRLGLRVLGRDRLVSTFGRLGFNNPRGLGNGVPSGTFLSPRDSFAIAEMASGFVRTTFMSPVHAALLMRCLADDGDLRPPQWDALPGDSLVVDSPALIADSIRRFMLPLLHATVDSGTARKKFDLVWPAAARQGIEVGGKTGSLNGQNPTGRYEWFAGFARRTDHPDSGIALAVMTVNDGSAYVPASWAAAQLFAWWHRSAPLLADPASALDATARREAFLTGADSLALSQFSIWRPARRWRGHKKKPAIVHVQRARTKSQQAARSR